MSSIIKTITMKRSFSLMVQMNFVLSGDYDYINQIETTAKSIIYHHHRAKIYIINKDIPQEWFFNINNHLRKIGSRLINLRIDANLLKNEYVSQPQINEMSYGRILIPDLINEDRVLYLDSDIIVEDDLSELFTMDLSNHPLAAITDVLYTDQFNSGVLLFNMPVIKEIPNIVDKMLKAGIDDKLTEGDQSVLNHFFKKTYLHLSLKYNLTIGYDFLCTYYSGYNHDYWNKTNINGKIIHFTSPSKPWHQFSTSRYRNKWWEYHNLSWTEVCQHLSLPKVLDYQEDGRIFIMTNSEDVKDLEQLVKALPKWTFNIGAFTNMGEKLTRLIRYSNIHLYPSIVRPVVDQLIKTSDCYLDINYGEKNEKVLAKFQETGKPIISFDEVNSNFKNESNYHSFKNNNIEDVINQIKRYRNKA